MNQREKLMLFDNFMVDLETMGTGNTAAICAIGVQSFNLNRRVLGPSTSLTVDLSSSVKYGGKIDADTVLFWMKQSDAARKPFIQSNRGYDLKEALSVVSDLIGVDKANTKVWGCGATFDNVILRNAYTSVGMEPPWMYWGDRCYRTLKSLYPNVLMERVGTHHNALDDAISQTHHLFKIMDAIEKSRD